MKYDVYHSSKISGLKVLEPRISTHKKAWIYATKDIVTSAMFLGDNFDFICQTGIQTLPYIWERFKGAFELAYKDKTGSIYILDGTNFKRGMTSWSEDLVSENKEKVKEEIRVNNVEEYLKELANKKQLDIYYYPNQPKHSPKDKSDIVQRGVEWTIAFGEGTLEQVEKYHPDVLIRIIEQLKTKNYVFKANKWRSYI